MSHDSALLAIERALNKVWAVAYLPERCLLNVSEQIDTWAQREDAITRVNAVPPRGGLAISPPATLKTGALRGFQAGRKVGIYTACLVVIVPCAATTLASQAVIYAGEQIGQWGGGATGRRWGAAVGGIVDVPIVLAQALCDLLGVLIAGVMAAVGALIGAIAGAATNQWNQLARPSTQAQAHC